VPHVASSVEVQFRYRNCGSPNGEESAADIVGCISVQGVTMDKYSLERVAGLLLGIAAGAVLGSVIFSPFGVPVPASASFGSVIGAVTGYLLASAMVYRQKRLIDREIAYAANSVRMELELPDTIRIRVKDGHVTLDGMVRYGAQRMQAERAISTIPGVQGVTNRLRFAPPAAA
jgi:uncharacterized membrane protein YeaQ/YmgE (transglycosylase-associated protein family)